MGDGKHADDSPVCVESDQVRREGAEGDGMTDDARILAIAALEAVEWTPDLNPASPVCYWCRGYKRQPAMDQDYYGKAGHKSDCLRQRALVALKASA
jgi:hypothetical protein